MDFEKICMMFSMQEPFYGILLSSMQREVDPNMDTIGVRRNGNVFSIGYNPAFIDKLPVDTVLEILKHECLHVALNHFTIWEDEYCSAVEHALRNIAEDLEINCYIDRNKISKEAGGAFVEDLDFQPNLGTREYYRLLLKKFEQDKQKEQAKNPIKPCNGGKGNNENSSDSDEAENGQNNEETPQDGNTNGPHGIHEDVSPERSSDSQNDEVDGEGSGDGTADGGDAQGIGSTGIRVSGTEDLTTEELAAQIEDFNQQHKPFDDHSEWPTADSDVEKMELEQLADDLLNFAAMETEKNCGDIPAGLQMRLEKIRKKPKPVTDWKRFFRRYIGNEFTDIFRKSKKRESKRFPDAPGNRHQRKSNILVAIDTSGSVSMPEYMEFFGQIKTLYQAANFHVLEIDTEIAYEYDFDGTIHQDVHGGGGTDFQPAVDFFNKDKKKYDALIYFTDGYATIPKDTPKETLWVISSNGDKSNKNKYKTNGANVVFIPAK